MSSVEPPTSPTPAELTEVDLLMRLARRWRRLGAQEQVAGGLAPHQERALLALARLSSPSRRAATEGTTQRRPPEGESSVAENQDSAGVRVSHLAGHLGIAARSATEVADALEDAGLLIRSPDPSDRRAVLLSLTGRGLHAVSAVRDRRRAAADAAVQALSPTDRAELRRLLHRLLDA